MSTGDLEKSQMCAGRPRSQACAGQCECSGETREGLVLSPLAWRGTVHRVANSQTQLSD